MKYQNNQNAQKDYGNKIAHMNNRSVNYQNARPKSANIQQNQKERLQQLKNKQAENYMRMSFNHKNQKNHQNYQHQKQDINHNKQSLQQKSYNRRYSDLESVPSTYKAAPDKQQKLRFHPNVKDYSDFSPRSRSSSMSSSRRSDFSRETASNNFKQLNTKRFLQTNIEEYLKHDDEHAKCYGCQDCMKKNQKLLQYKYSNKIKSNYADNFPKYDKIKRDEPFNHDKNKQEVKIKEEPIQDFKTTSMISYQPYKVEKAVASKTREKASAKKSNNQSQRKDVDPFVSSTTYNMSFANWEGGVRGKQSMKHDSQQIQMPRKLDNQTTYKNDFLVHDDKNAKLNDSLKRNELRDLNRKGTLSPSKKLPFDGKSTSNNTFKYQKDKIEQSQQCKPVDELMVPHQVKMQFDTVSRKDYDQKPIMQCKFQQLQQSKSKLLN
eukprot:403371852